MDARAFVAELKGRIDARLTAYLEDKRRETSELSPDSMLLVDGVAALTMRGGKRLRPAVLAAAHRAVSAGAELDAAVEPGAALELLQSFLLIHDDWMDADDERRGGPSVHAAFRTQVQGAHLADCLAVLAGDLAAAYAWELFLEAPWPVEVRRRAELRFLRIHKEVFFGQHLDLTASHDVARMHELKTGSYTVEGPMLLGALLGNATDAQVAVFERAAAPLGRAFQLADDLLGTFGDAAITGKPSGNDLRQGKHNAVVAAAEEILEASARGPLDVVLGLGAEADDAQVARAVALLEEAGVRAELERRLDILLAEADTAFAGGPLEPEGASLLRDLAGLLARRHR